MFVAPSERRASYDDQLAAARAGLPDDFRISQFIVSTDPTRTTETHADNGAGYRRVLVDPYRGAQLGMLSEDDLFPVVLKIHRTLFAGTLGRVVVELTICWTIVLLASGVYLWWPRKRGAVWGAWLPRLDVVPPPPARPHGFSAPAASPHTTDVGRQNPRSCRAVARTRVVDGGDSVGREGHDGAAMDSVRMPD